MKILSMHHQILFLISAVLCFWVSCQKKEMEDPRINEFINNPNQDTFDVMVLPEGETITLSQEKIVVREYGEINGTLLIEPNPTGEFSIVVLDGDLTIAGEIRVLETAQDTNGRVGKEHNQKAADGMDIRARTQANQTKLIIKRNAQFHTGSGKDASLTIQSSLYAQGIHGGDGGDLILESPSGEIQFEEVKKGDFPNFYLGSGGRGGDVIVDRNLESNSKDGLFSLAGNGGDGGRLITSATNITGLLSLEKMAEYAFDYLGTIVGAGGNGGHAIWDNTSDGWKGDQPLLSSTFKLGSISLQGGDGGNSLFEGGTGGSAIYWCDRAINPIGQRITPVNANGGDGGDVIPNSVSVPVYNAYGGNGGYTVVHGNYGWNGDRLIISGADAGDIYFKTGDGGDVTEDVKSVFSYGGNGGGNADNRAQLPKELGIDQGYQDLLLWILTGWGGFGNTSCEGCPGGRGGDAGRIKRGETGKGGAVLNDPYDDQGSNTGNGGNLWYVVNNGPGDGGDGSPPGKAGCVPSHSIVLGNAGIGAVPLGTPGEQLFNDVLPLSTYKEGDCGHRGEWCGENLTCEVPLPPQDTGCWKNEGRSFSWVYNKTSFNPANGSPLTIIKETGTAIGDQKYFYRTAIYYDYEGNLIDSHTLDQEDTRDWEGSNPSYYCYEGSLLEPGSAYKCALINKNTGRTSEITTKNWGGCMPTAKDLGLSSEELQKISENCPQSNICD